MKKAAVVFSIILTSLFLYHAVFPKYKFSHYYSKDKSKVLTRIEYPNAWLFLNKTYLTPGFYYKNQKPDVYIKPIPLSHGDWAEYVTFHSKGIFVIGENAEVKNCSDTFKYLLGTVTNYSENRIIDSLEKTFVDTSKIAIYSFDK